MTSPGLGLCFGPSDRNPKRTIGVNHESNGIGQENLQELQNH